MPIQDIIHRPGLPGNCQLTPLRLSAGWEQLPRAYNKGYTDADALKLGGNVFMYEISH